MTRKKIDQDKLHDAYNYAWRVPGEQPRTYARRFIDHRVYDHQAPDEREYGVEGKTGQAIRTDIDAILDGKKKK